MDSLLGVVHAQMACARVDGRSSHAVSQVHGECEPCGLDATVEWVSDDGGDCVWRLRCLFRRSANVEGLEMRTIVRSDRVQR